MSFEGPFPGAFVFSCGRALRLQIGEALVLELHYLDDAAGDDPAAVPEPVVLDAELLQGVDAQADGQATGHEVQPPLLELGVFLGLLEHLDRRAVGKQDDLGLQRFLVLVQVLEVVVRVVEGQVQKSWLVEIDVDEQIVVHAAPH